MKRYSTYLRKDQIEFLQKIGNASSFVREALDQHITSDTGKIEKTIVILEAIREIEQQIEEQKQLIASTEQKDREIQKDLNLQKDRIKLANQVAIGKFDIMETTNGYQAIATYKNKKIRIAKGNDKDALKEETIKLGKERLAKEQTSLNNLEKQAECSKKILDAYKRKLQLLQRELKKLQS